MPKTAPIFEDETGPCTFPIVTTGASGRGGRETLNTGGATGSTPFTTAAGPMISDSELSGPAFRDDASSPASRGVSGRALAMSSRGAGETGRVSGISG